jgi:hypothetical protein
MNVYDDGLRSGTTPSAAAGSTSEREVPAEGYCLACGPRLLIPVALPVDLPAYHSSAVGQGLASFVMRFDQDTELVGYPEAMTLIRIPLRSVLVAVAQSQPRPVH